MATLNGINLDTMTGDDVCEMALAWESYGYPTQRIIDMLQGVANVAAGMGNVEAHAPRIFRFPIRLL